MSNPDAHWITTAPEARLTSGPEKVSVRDSLAPGTRLLDEFEILGVLGTGGFGIVYLARDHLLQRDIAIKEYLPAVLSRRGEGAAVTMRASTVDCAESFAKGLESFLGEARLLASFDHPALIKVHRFWRDNGTAYMAMPYYPGQTLKDVRLQMLRGARRAVAGRAGVAAARRARGAAPPGCLPPRHRPGQHPDPARRHGRSCSTSAAPAERSRAARNGSPLT